MLGMYYITNHVCKLLFKREQFKRKAILFKIKGTATYSGENHGIYTPYLNIM